MVGSMLSLQWHICARIDDMMKLQFSNFSPNTQYPSTLHLPMRWSKNINEERDAPEQIVMGSMDPKMCALLNLGIYIESTANVTSSEFVYSNEKDGDRAENLEHTVYEKVLQPMRLEGDFKGLGRWRTRKGVVDGYIDNTQPYPDALTAATLTGPAGPCFYTLKAGICCVDSNLLVDQIAPTVKQLMGEAIATTLALPLLWAALEPSSNYEYDLFQVSCSRKFTGLFKSLNPVDRKEFYVTGDGSQLNLIVVASNEYTEHSAPALNQETEQAVKAPAVNLRLFTHRSPLDDNTRWR
ncbi:hypothetical protein PHMEG_00037679 [Phytophthora megakarya]|uniref:Uncharacterized protein n=1 Tax=Phytophthora megakarya TaxID=4795 RepID=A0A225UJE8_9STRA|nr:hypothetical protein PHMEG_00037679 [Phytophthora megakarya]